MTNGPVDCMPNVPDASVASPEVQATREKEYDVIHQHYEELKCQVTSLEVEKYIF